MLNHTRGSSNEATPSLLDTCQFRKTQTPKPQTLKPQTPALAQAPSEYFKALSQQQFMEVRSSALNVFCVQPNLLRQSQCIVTVCAASVPLPSEEGASQSAAVYGGPPRPSIPLNPCTRHGTRYTHHATPFTPHHSPYTTRHDPQSPSTLDNMP